MNEIQKIHYEYNSLIKDNLKVRSKDTIWAQNINTPNGYPEQGFKLHISSTLNESVKILSATINYLKHTDIMYKVCKDISELKKINSGLFYGYSQIGKFITIYPRTENQCIKIAKEMHLLTLPFKHVQIPNDLQLYKDSNVFYRYGLFINKEDDQIVIQNKKITDNRKYGFAIPDSKENILPNYNNSFNFKNILLLKALSKRGKGGVYIALELINNSFSNIILKEGINNGEIMEDNIDGVNRLKNEKYVLNHLIDAGVNVPKVLGSFEKSNNYYLKLEQIFGLSLNKYIKSRKRLLDYNTFKNIAVKIAKSLNKVNQSGIVWCDCKPDNIIYNTKKSKIFFIDFEGAKINNSESLVNWSSPGFSEPMILGKSKKVTENYDIYSFGATMYYLITKKILLKNEDRLLILKARRKYPKYILQMIYNMLDQNESNRPSLLEFIQLVKKKL